SSGRPSKSNTSLFLPTMLVDSAHHRAAREGSLMYCLPRSSPTASAGMRPVLIALCTPHRVMPMALPNSVRGMVLSSLVSLLLLLLISGPLCDLSDFIVTCNLPLAPASARLRSSASGARHHHLTLVVRGPRTRIEALGVRPPEVEIAYRYQALRSARSGHCPSAHGTSLDQRLAQAGQTALTGVAQFVGYQHHQVGHREHVLARRRSSNVAQHRVRIVDQIVRPLFESRHRRVDHLLLVARHWGLSARVELRGIDLVEKVQVPRSSAARRAPLVHLVPERRRLLASNLSHHETTIAALQPDGVGSVGREHEVDLVRQGVGGHVLLIDSDRLARDQVLDQAQVLSAPGLRDLLREHELARLHPGVALVMQVHVRYDCRVLAVYVAEQMPQEALAGA